MREWRLKKISWWGGKTGNIRCWELAPRHRIHSYPISHTFSRTSYYTTSQHERKPSILHQQETIMVVKQKPSYIPRDEICEQNYILPIFHPYQLARTISTEFNLRIAGTWRFHKVTSEGVSWSLYDVTRTVLPYIRDSVEEQTRLSFHRTIVSRLVQ